MRHEQRIPFIRLLDKLKLEVIDLRTSIEAQAEICRPGDTSHVILQSIAALADSHAAVCTILAESLKDRR